MAVISLFENSPPLKDKVRDIAMEMAGMCTCLELAACRLQDSNTDNRKLTRERFAALLISLRIIARDVESLRELTE